MSRPSYSPLLNHFNNVLWRPLIMTYVITLFSRGSDDHLALPEVEILCRMVSSWTLRHVALVRTDVSEELSSSFIRVTIFLRCVRRLLVTASVVPSSPILVTLMKEALSSSETSALTRATFRNVPEDAILHSHRRENLKSKYSLLNSVPEHLYDLHSPQSQKTKRSHWYKLRTKS
jgi:hypothetical protein